METGEETRLSAIVNAHEIESTIKANVGKKVCVLYADGTTETLVVHTVDNEGFVCDLASEVGQRPPYAYWVFFTDVREARPG